MHVCDLGQSTIVSCSSTCFCEPTFPGDLVNESQEAIKTLPKKVEVIRLSLTDFIHCFGAFGRVLLALTAYHQQPEVNYLPRFSPQFP